MNNNVQINSDGDELFVVNCLSHYVTKHFCKGYQTHRNPLTYPQALLRVKNDILERH